jgi:hypothetical protein
LELATKAKEFQVTRLLAICRVAWGHDFFDHFPDFLSGFEAIFLYGHWVACLRSTYGFHIKIYAKFRPIGRWALANKFTKESQRDIDYLKTHIASTRKLTYF